MRARRMVACGLACALLALTPVSARRAVTMTEWTTSPQLALPSAGDGISVTPNASSDAFSNWIEMSASLSSDVIVTGLVAKWTAGCSILGERFISELGVGAASSEATVVTAIKECGTDADNAYILLAVPLKLSSGSRLAVRFRKNNTNTTIWRFAITYIALPFVGSISYTSTTSASGVFGSGSVTPSGSSWGNSNWAEMTTAANNSTATVYGASYSINYNGGATCATAEGEVEIGTGGSGSEAAVSFWHFGQNGNLMSSSHYFRPVLSIAASTRVAVRLRKSGTSTAACAYRVIRQAVGSDDVSGISTTQGQTWSPSAANATSVTSGTTSWANATNWTQFVASLGSDAALTSFYFDPSAALGEYEVEFGVGAASAETVVATIRIAGNGGHAPGVYSIYPAVNLASGSRLAARVRTSVNAATATSLAVGYISSPTFKARTSAVPSVYPLSSNGVTVTPSGSGWGNSGYQQLTSSTSAPLLVTSITYHFGAGATPEVEFDLATGGSGSETVFTTLRSAAITNSVTKGPVLLPLPAPHYIAAGSRIAIRMRKTGTDTTGWTRIALNYTPTEAGFPPLSVPVPFILSQHLESFLHALRSGWRRVA